MQVDQRKCRGSAGASGYRLVPVCCRDRDIVGAFRIGSKNVLMVRDRVLICQGRKGNRCVAACRCLLVAQRVQSRVLAAHGRNSRREGDLYIGTVFIGASVLVAPPYIQRRDHRLGIGKHIHVIAYGSDTPTLVRHLCRDRGLSGGIQYTGGSCGASIADSVCDNLIGCDRRAVCRLSRYRDLDFGQTLDRGAVHIVNVHDVIQRQCAGRLHAIRNLCGKAAGLCTDLCRAVIGIDIDRTGAGGGIRDQIHKTQRNHPGSTRSNTCGNRAGSRTELIPDGVGKTGRISVHVDGDRVTKITYILRMFGPGDAGRLGCSCYRIQGAAAGAGHRGDPLVAESDAKILAERIRECLGAIAVMGNGGGTAGKGLGFVVADAHIDLTAVLGAVYRDFPCAGGGCGDPSVIACHQLHLPGNRGAVAFYGLAYFRPAKLQRIPGSDGYAFASARCHINHLPS